jgi:putative ABC transport system substrate-binding protein
MCADAVSCHPSYRAAASAMDGLNRREFITLLGGAATAWSLAARAQQSGGRLYRIGFLGATSPPAAAHLLDAFRDGMRERGYIEGRNLIVDYRPPAASPEQNREVAAELVGGGCDVILAWTTPSLIAARAATATVPIVFVGGRSRPGDEPGAAGSERHRHHQLRRRPERQDD